jgi:hypothetical protein
MRAASRRRLVRVHKFFFSALTVIGFSVAVTTVMTFVTTFRVKEIAPFFLPTLAAFFGFSSLLYNRARAYPEGPTQRRALYAANGALTATILYLVALILGAIITYVILGSNVDATPRELSFEDPRALWVLILYWLPLLFIGLSYNEFSNSLRLFSVDIILFKRRRQQLRSMMK